jgi:hypothetical protein
MGFHDKANAKRCLVKHFVADKDYTVSLLRKEEQTIGRGGGNKQVQLTVPAFKRGPICGLSVFQITHQ